jgi:hypothetical protein
MECCRSEIIGVPNVGQGKVGDSEGLLWAGLAWCTLVIQCFNAVGTLALGHQATIPTQAAVGFAHETRHGKTSDPISLIAGATMCEAFYMALVKDGTSATKSPKIQQVLKRGLREVTLLDPRTPPDVLQFFKAIGNKFNGVGAKESYMELLKLVPDILKHRDDYTAEKRKCGKRSRVEEDAAADDVPPLPSPSTDAPKATATAKKGAKRSQAGDEKEYHEWLEKHYPGRFPKWADWDAARVFYNKIVKIPGAWSAIGTYVAQHGVFTDARLNMNDVIKCWDQLLRHLEQRAGELTFLITSLIKFTIPTSDGTPWLIYKTSDIQSRCLQLFIPMKASKLYKAEKKKLLDAKHEEEVDAAPAKNTKTSKANRWWQVLHSEASPSIGLRPCLAVKPAVCLRRIFTSLLPDSMDRQTFGISAFSHVCM